MTRIHFLYGSGILLLLLLFALGLIQNDPLSIPQEQRQEIPFTRVQSQDLSSELQKWVHDSRAMHLAQSKTVADTQYILLTYGNRPKSYDVAVETILQVDDRIEVWVQFTQTQYGQPPTPEMGQPYDLIAMEPREGPIRFVALGDEEYIPTLQ